jgi:Skp family chaperone for outer membrane proteins
MKLLKRFTLILIILIFNVSFANSNDQIAFFDLDLVIKKSNIGIKTLKKINKLNNENIQKLKINENELKKQESEIKKKENILSSEELKKEISLLQNNLNKFRKNKDTMVSNFNKNKNIELENLFKLINPIIQNFMEKNSINILIERKNVFLGKINSDITSDLINLINKEIK